MRGPREDLISRGAESLSDTELLAVLLGTGQTGESAAVLAARLMKKAGGLWGLRRMSPAELARLSGIGPAKAARLAAAFEAGLRALTFPDEHSAPLSNSEATYGVQAVGVVAIGVFVFAVSFVVWTVLRITVGIRIDAEDESLGIDQAEIGMEAYPEFGATR